MNNREETILSNNERELSSLEYTDIYNNTFLFLSDQIPGVIIEDVLAETIYTLNDEDPMLSRFFLNLDENWLKTYQFEKLYETYIEKFSKLVTKRPKCNIKGRNRKPRNDQQLLGDTRYRNAAFKLTIADYDKYFDHSEENILILNRLFHDLGKIDPKGSLSLYNVFWESLSEVEMKTFQAGLTEVYQIKQVPDTLKEQIIKLSEVATLLDQTVSKQLEENRWYLEAFEMPARIITAINELFLAIQIAYRGENRKKDTAKRGSMGEKERAVNHFLGVQRTAYAIIDLARNNLEKLPISGAQFHSTFNSEQDLFELSVTTLIHDLLEDTDKETGKPKFTVEELRVLLHQNLITADAHENIIGIGLIDKCIKRAQLLNTRNYPKTNPQTGEYLYNQKGKPEIDHRAYIKGIRESNDPTLLLTKAADILVNRRTNPNDYHGTTKTSEKELVYIEYIHFMTIEKGLIPCLPGRFIADIILQYPEWTTEEDAKECLDYWINNMGEGETKEFLLARVGDTQSRINDFLAEIDSPIISDADQEPVTHLL